MSLWIYGFIFIELIIISIIDIQTKKISNFWSLGHVFVAMALYLISRHYTWSWPVLIYPIAWLILGFTLFLLGIMGAGDSKLLGSLYLIIPIGFHHLMLEKLIISTLVVGFMNLTLKIAKDFRTIKAYALSGHWPGLWEKMKSRFSYAPVVLMAWILMGVQLWL
jgi:prepilin peptidase CpaA